MFGDVSLLLTWEVALVSSGGIPAFIQSTHFYVWKVFYKAPQVLTMVVQLPIYYDNTFFLSPRSISYLLLDTSKLSIILHAGDLYPTPETSHSHTLAQGFSNLFRWQNAWKNDAC